MSEHCGEASMTGIPAATRNRQREPKELGFKAFLGRPLPYSSTTVVLSVLCLKTP